jgi:hypothetical protein
MVVFFFIVAFAAVVVLGRWSNAYDYGFHAGRFNQEEKNKYVISFIRATYSKGYLKGVTCAGYSDGKSFNRANYRNIHTPGSVAAATYNAAYEDGRAAAQKLDDNVSKNAAQL